MPGAATDSAEAATFSAALRALARRGLRAPQEGAGRGDLDGAGCG